MFLRNIKTFIKHLGKNKMYTSITILGFSHTLSRNILLTNSIKIKTGFFVWFTTLIRVLPLLRDNY